MCSHIHYAVSLIINFAPVFTVFASLKHSCFQWGLRARATLLLGGLVARIPGFLPGYPGPGPGQETKISLQDSSLLSLRDHKELVI